MARRRRKSGLLKTITRALKAYRTRQRRKRAVTVRAAKKASVRSQTQIRKESRTTAGELQASGQYVWEGQGMPDSTVMEPVRTKNGWEWVPAKQQPAGVRKQINSPTVVQPSRHGVVGWTTVGELRQQGHGDLFSPEAHDNQTVMINPDGTVRPNIRTRSPGDGHWAEAAPKCGAPTKDKTPCERLGDCPIRSHQTWRKANQRG